jgi:hypothetical protein
VPQCTLTHHNNKKKENSGSNKKKIFKSKNMLRSALASLPLLDLIPSIGLTPN